MNLHTFTDSEEFIKKSTDFIAHVCNETSEIVRISLSGGSTPAPILKALSKRNNIEFDQVEFYQVDERYVPKDHANSNYRMIYLSLIQHLEKKLKAFYYFDTSLSIEECIREYEKNLNSKVFDLTVLGMGTDGHIASLFPHSEALGEEKKLVIHTTTQEHAVHDRLSITMPVILASKKILLLLKGENKKKILDDLIHSTNTIDELPAKALLSHRNLTIYFLNK